MSSHKSKSQESSVKSGQVTPAETKATPAETKAPSPPKPQPQPEKEKGSVRCGEKKKEKGPCPRMCTLVPTDVPAPELAQRILHPKKDVFVLKVAKIGPNGDRHCKMELELVTPKPNMKVPPYRVDTRETQCDPECSCCSKCTAKRHN